MWESRHLTNVVLVQKKLLRIITCSPFRAHTEPLMMAKRSMSLSNISGRPVVHWVVETRLWGVVWLYWWWWHALLHITLELCGYRIAPVPYPAVPRFGAEMVTFLFRCGALWGVKYVHCEICKIAILAHNNPICYLCLPTSVTPI